MNGISKLNQWANSGDYSAMRSAQGYLNQDSVASTGTGCGSSCGAKEGDSKPNPAPSACGAGDGDTKPKPAPSACGAGDGDAKPKPSACGSSCGSGDK